MSLIQRIVCIAFLVLPAPLYAACTGASPMWRSTADYSSVNTCLGYATAGDTINVSGTATWSTYLTITKAINLIGAGSSSAAITAAFGPIIYIDISSDVAVRISGFMFDNVVNNSGRYGVLIAKKSFISTKIRIDHNKFSNASEGVYSQGPVYGVIDSNIFLNCSRAIMIVGDRNAAWSRPIAAGTADALFIEDNTFTANAFYGNKLGLQIYHQDGARTVTRYNTFNFGAATGYNQSDQIFDSHGNQTLYTGAGADFRGQPIIEVYNNSFRGIDNYDFMVLRSGSVLVYNNTFYREAGELAGPIWLQEEEAWTSGGTFTTKPASAGWPAQDQITNSFFWNNTSNGDPVGVTMNVATDLAFIQENRDYFLHAPAATGGKSNYPTRAGASDMTFSSSGANAYYPYTPYTYPHPLTKPVPPRALGISQ